MTNETGEDRSPFTRPGFLVAGLVVAIILVFAVVLVATNAARSNSESNSESAVAVSPISDVSTSTESTQPPGQSSENSNASASDKSVCGLKGEVLSKERLPIAPESDGWDYQGKVAYPVSKEFGPGAYDETGNYRYCFQHSPTGAVYAAVNAVAQGTEPERAGPWLKYFVAKGPHRDDFLALGPGEGSSDSQGVRLRVVGYILQNYTGQKATVDVGIQAIYEGKESNLSMIYNLVWEDGDWKMVVSDPKTPIDVAAVPDFAPYVRWGA